MPAAWPQLLHVRVAGALERVDEGSPERRAVVPKQLDRGRDALLVVLGELVPPRPERVGVLDFPHHITIRSNF